MGTRFEPFALMLHRRHAEGETVAQLAATFRIPEERVAQRLRVAASFARREAERSSLGALNSEIGRDNPG